MGSLYLKMSYSKNFQKRLARIPLSGFPIGKLDLKKKVSNLK